MKAARKYLPGTTLRKNRLDCMTMRRPTAPDDSRSSQSGTARNFFSAVSTRGLGKNGAKKEPTFQRLKMTGWSRLAYSFTAYWMGKPSPAPGRLPEAGLRSIVSVPAFSTLRS